MERRWIKLGLHVLWWIVLLMALSVFLASKLNGYALLQTACGDVPHCDNSLRLTADGAADLERYGLSATFYSGLLVVFMSIANLSYIVIGGLLYRYRGNEAFGMAASMFLIVIGTIFCTDEQALRDQPVLLAFFRLLDNVGSFYLPFLYLFPDGRFVPRWTVIPSALWVAVQSFRFVFPDAWSVLNWEPSFMTAALLVTHGPLVFALVRRYRQAKTALERRRLKWFLFSVCAYVGSGSLLALSYVLQDGLLQLFVQVAFFAGLLFWPFSIGMGVLERQLDNVNASLHRAFLASIMGFLIVLLYAATVGSFSMLLRGQDLLVSLVASGVIAASFHPIYIRLRRGINRLVYGDSESPYRLLTALVARMDRVVRKQSVWSDVVQSIAQALGLPYAGIEVLREGASERLAEFGRRSAETTAIPLQWNGERIGTLVLGASRIGGMLSGEMEELLSQLVRQLSVSLHSARLAEELQQSRERLVAAREEERRRLGRDLHDGLGAGLASVLLKADAVEGDYERDAELSRRLADIRGGIEEAIRDVRRLVYSLRPPALDEFGLLFAVRELAVDFGQSGLRVEVEAPDRLPALNAATEVALYRIAQEALTNAIRHGGASRCRVAFEADRGRIALAIEDNGRGMPHAVVPGVGIRSMKERASELGGSCVFAPAGEGQGTCVRVDIPYAANGEAEDIA